MEIFFFALAIIFGPTVLYVWMAAYPDSTGFALPFAFIATILPFGVKAVLHHSSESHPEDKRLAQLNRTAASARWAGIVVMLTALIVVPKLMWAVHMNWCGMTELATGREQVERFRKTHGRAPLNLDELGSLPRLRIWTITEQEANHIHPATSRVSILRDGVPPPDDGSWGYDPDTGRIFLSCTGKEPKLRKHSLYEL